MKRLLSAIFARLEQENRSRPVVGERNSIGHHLQMVLVVLIAVAILLFLVDRFASLIAWPPSVYRHPDVTNLTLTNHPWNLFHSADDLCPTQTCAFQVVPPGETVVLPHREFRFKNSSGKRFAFYTTKIKLNQPPNESHVLHALWICAKNWRIYVNVAARAEASASQLHAMITAEEAANELEIVIKLEVDPTAHQGIANFGDLIIGPRQIIEPYRDLGLQLRNDFKTWLLLPRITLCLLFCFVSMVFRRYRENYYFTLFAALISARLVLEMYPSLITRISDLPLTFYLAFVDLAQLVSLAFFFHSYTRRNAPLAPRMVGSSALLIALVLLATVDLALRDSILKAVSDIGVPTIRSFVYGYGVYTTLISGLFLLSIGHAGHRTKVLWVLSACFSMAFIFSLVQMFVAAVMYFQGGAVFEGVVRIRTGMAPLVNELIFFFVLGIATVLDFGVTVKQRDQIRQTFGKFVGNDVIDIILAEKSNEGRLRNVTVLFIDIRGFTSLLERADPKVVVKLLNQYFEVVTQAALATSGVVDKFIGDAVMVVWGMAKEMTVNEQADHAIAAAQKIMIDLDLLFSTPIFDRQGVATKLSYGIGVHAGEAVVGELGSENRKEFSVIGDAVNVAARLQDLTKSLGVRLLISEAVVANLPEVSPHLVKMQSTAIRGRSAEIAVYTTAGELQGRLV